MNATVRTTQDTAAIPRSKHELATMFEKIYHSYPNCIGVVKIGTKAPIAVFDNGGLKPFNYEKPVHSLI
jgi:hypothetical protein